MHVCEGSRMGLGPCLGVGSYAQHTALPRGASLGLLESLWAAKRHLWVVS